MGRIKDITNQRFGKLLVIKQAPRQEKKQSAWICLCDCGIECIKRGTALRYGWVQSCGCMGGLGKHPNYIKSVIKWVMRMYVGGAKSRELPFNLSQKQFVAIIQRPCHYCGDTGRDWGQLWYQEKLRRIQKRATKTFDSRAAAISFIASGIDRIMNEKGYSISNCVPCCTTCNMMKKALTEEEFFNHIKRVMTYRNLL